MLSKYKDVILLNHILTCFRLWKIIFGNKLNTMSEQKNTNSNGQALTKIKTLRDIQFSNSFEIIFKKKHQIRDSLSEM